MSDCAKQSAMTAVKIPSTGPMKPAIPAHVGKLRYLLLFFVSL